MNISKYGIFILTALFAQVVLALDPATCTFTNYRDEAVAAASAAEFYRGNVVRFTNCIVYSGGSGSSVQNLSGVTLTVSMGDGKLGAQTVTGAVQVATSGTWSASATIRTNEGTTVNLEVQLTDGTNTYVYPHKTLTTKGRL